MLALLTLLAGVAWGAVDPVLTAELVSEPNQFLFDCNPQGINVCQVTMDTKDQVVASVGRQRAKEYAP